MEEEKPEEKPEEEVKPTYLEEVKSEREKMEKILADLRELRTEEVLSGKIDAAKPEDKPAEETPNDYAKKIMKGS